MSLWAGAPPPSSLASSLDTPSQLSQMPWIPRARSGEGGVGAGMAKAQMILGHLGADPGRPGLHLCQGCQALQLESGGSPGLCKAWTPSLDIPCPPELHGVHSQA